MAYWFFNTDADARKDAKTCDLWFKYGMAFSGGLREKYGEPLSELQASDICLMYHNTEGIVGVGRVLEPWDGISHSDKFVYQNFDGDEYRIRVDWYIDLRGQPPDPVASIGYVPPSFLQRITTREDVVEKLIKQQEGRLDFRLPEEIRGKAALREGSFRTVTVDVHEYRPAARQQCISHWGAVCKACGLDLAKKYGPIAEGFIHVHHLNPMASAAAEREVDPVSDLRPLCPNCHAIIHKRRTEPYTISEVQGFIQDTRKKTRGQQNFAADTEDCAAES